MLDASQTLIGLEGAEIFTPKVGTLLVDPLRVHGTWNGSNWYLKGSERLFLYCPDRILLTPFHQMYFSEILLIKIQEKTEGKSESLSFPPPH